MKDRSAHGGGSPKAPKNESPITQEEDAGEAEDKEGFESASEEPGGLEQSDLIWVGGFCFFLLFCAVWQFWGEGVAGIPHCDGASSSGVGNWYT